MTESRYLPQGSGMAINKSCQCDRCIRCCKNNPGWFTPGEAIKAIRAGFAGKMMRDWLEPSEKVGNKERIWVLSPAASGFEGRDAPEMDFSSFFQVLSHTWKRGRCVMLQGRRCSIHASGFKPIECRITFGCSATAPKRSSHSSIAKLWRGPLGAKALRLWQERVRAERKAGKRGPR